MNYPKFIFAALLAATIPTATAFQLDKQSVAVEVGAATVVEIDGETYALTDVPTYGYEVKFEFDRPAVAVETGVSTGCETSEKQVIQVLEAWYRKYSIDYDSIKIRNLTLHGLRYATWCSNWAFFICTNTQIRAGQLIEYEVNGANRQSGMTGYQRRIQMVRKNPKAGRCPD